jgi:hypothetical protein
MSSARRCRVLLWCHGNADVINRLDNSRIVSAWIVDFIFDYRGWPEQASCRKTGLSRRDRRLRYLTRVRQIRPERIVVFGRSLSAAVAADLSRRSRRQD